MILGEIIGGSHVQRAIVCNTTFDNQRSTALSSDVDPYHVPFRPCKSQQYDY